MHFKELTLWTALVTPMKEDGRIDFKDLETLVRRQEAAGNGILLLGSTGEGLALDAGEKASVVEFVTKMNPETAVMAGVGGFNLREQENWVSACNEFGVDAFLLVAPLYSKPGPVGMEKWFRSLMDRAGRPCMLYNIPGRTGIRIPPAVVRNLSDHPSLWSLKEASGAIGEYRAFREAVPHLPVFSGDDALLPVFTEAGCSGLVSVAANVWPEATARYVTLCLEGRCESFGTIWERAVEALFSVSNPIPAKTLLVEKGWISNHALRLPLTPEEITDTGELLAADREVSNWYEEGLENEKTI